MKKYLSEKGLSMSNAQSISNLCNQLATEIERKIESINNSKKVVKVDDETYVNQESNPMPKDIINLLMKKGSYHALQAYLMEMIKYKDSLLRELEYSDPEITIEKPSRPLYEHTPEIVYNKDRYSFLTPDERVEYLELEAYAAHIGQFIHKNGKLSKLRKELSGIHELEFIHTTTGKEYPVRIIKHHSPEELMEVHENLSRSHRDYEKRLNYLKSKSLTLMNEHNAKIEAEYAKNLEVVNNINSKLSDEYEKELDNYKNKLSIINSNHREYILKESSRISKLKIVVPTRFKDIVEELMG